MSDQARKISSGTGSVTNSAKTTNVLAAPGAGKKLRLRLASLYITVAAAGGSGTWQLNDGAGGSAIVKGDANAVGNVQIQLGDSDGIGYDLGANNALQLQVANAVTTEASVNAAVVATVLI